MKQPNNASRTFTLNVISSMTYTLSGNALATSSTLLKYCTGSLTSLSCSSNLNWPKVGNKVGKNKSLERRDAATPDLCLQRYSHLRP